MIGLYGEWHGGNPFAVVLAIGLIVFVGVIISAAAEGRAAARAYKRKAKR